jgi:hypothetical protein
MPPLAGFLPIMAMLAPCQFIKMGIEFVRSMSKLLTYMGDLMADELDTMTGTIQAPKDQKSAADRVQATDEKRAHEDGAHLEARKDDYPDDRLTQDAKQALEGGQEARRRSGNFQTFQAKGSEAHGEDCHEEVSDDSHLRTEGTSREGSLVAAQALDPSQKKDLLERPQVLEHDHAARGLPIMASFASVRGPCQFITKMGIKIARSMWKSLEDMGDLTADEFKPVTVTAVGTVHGWSPDDPDQVSAYNRVQAEGQRAANDWIRYVEAAAPWREEHDDAARAAAQARPSLSAGTSAAAAPAATRRSTARSASTPAPKRSRPRAETR